MSTIATLPRGRHHFTREEVTASQRGRMLGAITEAVAEKGYPATSVADVLRRARVSRQTFYENFANKEACFLAAYDCSVDLLTEVIAEAVHGESSGPVATFDRILRAYLETLAAQPSVAQTFLVEVHCAGPRILARVREVQRHFVQMVADVFGARTEEERFACEALVASISCMVSHRVGAQRLDELPTLREPILGIVKRWLALRGDAR